VLPISYSLGNVTARPGRSLVLMTVVALVVVACSLFLGLLSSLRRTVASTGDPMNLVVLRKGSDNDGSSQITRLAYDSVRYLDGIALGPQGERLVSPELVVQPFFWTKEGGRENVLVRGVEPAAFEVHPDVQIVEGRMFRPRLNEVLIGKALRGRYRGAEIGQVIEFGRNKWTVVGIVASNGSSFESEVWVDGQDLANDARRLNPYSGVRVRAASENDLQALKARIDADPRYALEASRETEYYAKQAETAGSLTFLVVAIAVLAGTGAGFGAANTMYASVQARTAEIGTLRALGFPRSAILISFEIESLVLSVGGFVLGALLSLLLAEILRVLLGGISFGARTFTTNLVTLSILPGDLVLSLLLSLVIGLFGGLGPAWRAARLSPIEALRKG
jgi:putative ABC transport system permease protein